MLLLEHLILMKFIKSIQSVIVLWDMYILEIVLMNKVSLIFVRVLDINESGVQMM
ncbi:Uncharacterised protein [Mycobacteroides abscessus subsp. abscessus]|nr:Uncharacterised protein [Mycobacteroides abscessus]SIN58906.1 Uncharacterised protein [Mycobacteroides abscessus subsp. abscessus]